MKLWILSVKLVPQQMLYIQLHCFSFFSTLMSWCTTSCRTSDKIVDVVDHHSIKILWKTIYSLQNCNSMLEIYGIWMKWNDLALEWMIRNEWGWKRGDEKKDLFYSFTLITLSYSYWFSFSLIIYIWFVFNKLPSWYLTLFLKHIHPSPLLSPNQYNSHQLFMIKISVAMVIWVSYSQLAVSIDIWCCTSMYWYWSMKQICMTTLGSNVITRNISIISFRFPHKSVKLIDDAMLGLGEILVEDRRRYIVERV